MMHEAGDPDLALFQEQKGIDEKSFTSLSELTPTDQIVVIDVVNGQDCKNPSAVTWSAVRQIKTNPAPMRLQYILKHLDERATGAVSGLPYPAQCDLAMRVDLSRVRNLSAIMWSQVKLVGNGPRSFPGSVPAPPPFKSSFREPPPPAFQARMAPGWRGASDGWSGPDTMDPFVHDFAMRSCLDDKVMGSISTLHPEEQHLVVHLVEKQHCRNPSAVCWSMVKHVRENPAAAKWQYLKGCLDGNAAEELDRLPITEQSTILSQVDVCTCRNISAFITSRVSAIKHGHGSMRGPAAPYNRPIPPPPPARNGYAAQFSQRGPDRSRTPRPVQRLPIDGPPLTVPEFAEKLSLDERAVEALSALSPEDQEVAMRLTESQEARNPSAFCWSMVKLVRENPHLARMRAGIKQEGEGEEAPPGGAGVDEPPFDATPYDPTPYDPDKVDGEAIGQPSNNEQANEGQLFDPDALPDPYEVAGITLDDRCLAALRELTPAQQLSILQSVDPQTCRNPSAMVFSRVRAAKGR
mmetsp:Transcript_98167/g.194411  ORF Transcript_98167/g.194411 Transcript_98167/m.194411 type:complete len:522 (+) Transcript_98167:57-1622(+)